MGLTIKKRTNHLDLASLPSVDLLGLDGWQSVARLPKAPGIYTVIADVTSRPSVSLTPSDLVRYQIAALQVFGNHSQTIETITSRGNIARVNLYIGMSGNLHKRWTGRGQRQHHKLKSLQAMGSLLNVMYHVRSLRLHYGVTADRDTALRLEEYLIDLHQPVSNGKAALSVR